MADDGAPAPEQAAAIVQEILAGLPAGCSWLVPVTGPDGAVTDFRIAAAGGQVPDIYNRGTARRDRTVAGLYPTMIGGPLWQLYLHVLETGEPGELPDFVYDQAESGVVARSVFTISVRPMLGGLLVVWQREDEQLRRLTNTELLGSLGWTEYDLHTGRTEWSPGMYPVFGRDPADGPLSRMEQAALMLPEDRGLAETAWQTLDSGATSDVTVRFRVGDAIKHLRILADTARDGAGKPIKIYAVVQDVTARVDTRSEIERLGDQLRTREMTALAEHRLAGQLQNMIQPVPREPFPLAGLEAMVSYLPAERAVLVGGDWYHAQTLPDGLVALAVGDVAGHGLDAASGMAHLRFALVAWLSIGLRDPGVLMHHLNRLCLQLRITGTAVIAVFDPATRVLRWARAGHPAPLLSRCGATTELERPHGLLLGAVDDADYPECTPELSPDDVILFYTDGLVERRAGDPAAQFRRVRDALAAAGPDLPRVHATLNEPSTFDDTCTLAVRVLPS
ncbi:serine phosphatase RsbU (regulator of sigma subunit) [Catenuloplanes nepalensis]|uniref:Serine phosphatase RsbU (Regulator of sigma subunit) n=1 Tax=Catenuloplanes nepalensis TaxID=587533 RepID=A0ABT9MLN4_9ACTN|nr:PP2C family protein-serine/threonine phosphatase [Catenuloplanes nepalensis]MDP9792326.1 serine phosphatase RsbU (regulator of sigma subunit) [Catenuloplanes nepalensis]